jgi:hypothetical protein
MILEDNQASGGLPRRSLLNKAIWAISRTAANTSLNAAYGNHRVSQALSIFRNLLGQDARIPDKESR